MAQVETIGPSCKRLAKSAWPDWQQGSATVNNTIRYDNSTERNVECHSTTTFMPEPQELSHPNPTGPSTLTQLSSRAHSQNIMLKHRASALIQKYSGTRWREAQRTKWLLDIVFHIDRDYRQYITEQAAEIAVLHQQLEQTTAMQAAAAEGMQAQNEQLKRRTETLEQQLRQTQGALLDMQNRVAASEIALQEAEEASRAAAEECHELQQAVAVLAEHDASARKLLANRSHRMKEELVASRGRMRQTAETSKRHRLEVAELLQQQRQQADQERQALTAQHQASMAAASTLLGAATRLNGDALRLELEAYKEPWAYVAGRDKSPTKRRDVTQRLGLKQKSMNVTIPF